MPLDKAYAGQKRKLVLGIDVGTTYSGVSFCILDPGTVPQIRSVTRWPGQEDEQNVRGTKIPTIMYYNEDGKVCAVGAETRMEGNRIKAQDENWVIAEWFKLHLRPRELASSDEYLRPLPPNKTVIQVLADFMKYLYQYAKKYISENDPIGRNMLQTEENVEFILAHPNGWGGNQQAKMRRAAVLAGLVPDSSAGQSRIHFVTEGEASLHYCINNGLAGNVIKNGGHLMIVDAGGGTVDLSTYKIRSAKPVEAVEATAADCVMQGSTFVNARADQFLREKLKASRFGNDEDIEMMLTFFENSTKPTFRDSTQASYIRFGGPRDTDEQSNIKRGTLTLPGSEMATLFRLCVSGIEDAMQRQVSGARGRVDMVLLVGGFAGSPYLRKELQAFAQREGLSLFCPETQPAKAVAEGALSHYIDPLVSARVAKYAYGSSCSRPYIPFLPAHIKRQDKVGVGASGMPLVPDAFSTIIPKGTLVSKSEEFEESFVQNTFSSINEISSDITRYKGSERSPHWMDEEPEMFETLFTIRANISHVPKVQKHGLRGDYYEQELKVIFLFGLTEFEAHLSWMENGQEKRSPAAIIYEDDTE